MKGWLSGISDALDTLLSGPQARPTGSVPDRREGGPTAEGLWAQWRAMTFPREFGSQGVAKLVDGVDVERLVDDATSFLDRYFADDKATLTSDERDRLVARFDRAIPNLQREPRGYLAMGREVLRRIRI